MRLLTFSAVLCALSVSLFSDEHDTPFTLADLPYPAEALEPVIDQKTMEIHHGRHHQAYVNNLNAAVEDHPSLAEMSLKDIQRHISQFDTAVRNNGGGHYNHTLFWTLMAPVGAGGSPSPALLAQIEEDFGSLEAMQQAFQQAGASQFGSGWAWLIWNGEQLQVTATANQDNPLMDVIPEDEQGYPLLANDVWEHAYYLSYQNQRGAYLEAWWQVVNWEVVNQRFAAITDATAASDED
ncbi:MAG: superoxide dismutase [Planctomycetota bacterium]|nr:MAG: superoxide dismutase [Planctomycetota bacterium]